MNDMLFYLISSCLYFAILKVALGIFFVKRDVPRFLILIIWCLFYIIEIIGTKCIDIPIYLLMFEIGSSFCLCFILYYGTLRKKLIWISVINLMGMITETIVGYMFVYGEFETNYTKLFGSFMSKILLLMILYGLKLSNYSRIKRDIPVKYWCVLFSISLGSIFVLNTIFILSDSVEDKSTLLLAILSSTFILGVNFIIFHVYESLSDRMEIQKQQIVFNKQIELCKNQIQEREESNFNIRNIKHDITNHLVCIREYMERNEVEYAKKYVEELLHGGTYFNENSEINSGNIVVDALLNYKYTTMKQFGIKMNTHIEIPYHMEMNDADICVVLGNCLDNSIEAVSKIKDEKLRFIHIELVYRMNNLLFEIRNPYAGNIIKDKHGDFLTTKKDAENHGIGLNSVKKAVKKYDGQVEIFSDNGVFRVRILLYTSGKNYI